MKKKKTLLNLALIGAVLFVGCDVSQSDLDATSDVQVRMQVNSATAAKASKFSADQELNSVVIEEVKLFIDEMELESIENDSADFEIENFIATLPLDGTPLVITEAEIPAGKYDEFELEIEKPDDDALVNDIDFRDETGSYSVVIKGLFNDEKFTFRSSEDFEIDIDLNPPFELTEDGSSVLIISIDVNSWFKDADGVDLDPKDPNNTEQINENIEFSFEGFEDEFDDD